MPGTFSACHPQQVATLKQLGVPSGDVTQGWGYARASAGYHNPEGLAAGDQRQFSSCFDLRALWARREPLNRLVQAGVVPFPRTAETGWRGSAHIHCITVGLRDYRGRVTILPGPRAQILDFIRGLNGLVGHAAFTGSWVPSREQRQEIRQHYETWAPDLATSVYRGDEQLYCYAWYESGVVRCDVRRLGEALGGRVTWTNNGAHLFADHGQEVRLLSGRLEVDYYRANVREVAEAFGYEVRFVALQDGAACRVTLHR